MGGGVKKSCVWVVTHRIYSTVESTSTWGEMNAGLIILRVAPERRDA